MTSNALDICNLSEESEEDDLGITASHKYKGIFSITQVLSVEEFQEQLEYETACCKSSSWEIVIKIAKRSNFKDFELFVRLMRVDSSNVVVEGILIIWLLNKEGKRCPVPYRLECVASDQITAQELFMVDPHYKCLLRKENKATFPDDELVFKVQLFVKGCCEQNYKDQCVTEKHSKAEGAITVFCIRRI